MKYIPILPSEAPHPKILLKLTAEMMQSVKRITAGFQWLSLHEQSVQRKMSISAEISQMEEGIWIWKTLDEVMG